MIGGCCLEGCLEMKTWVRIRKAMIVLIACAICVFVGCASSHPHKSQQEIDVGYYWYEGIFLDSEAVQAAFKSVSDDYPKYEIVPDHYHITTSYKSDIRHDDLYGSAVSVHVVGYAAGTVRDEEEGVTSDNEGLLVELTAENEDLQTLIDNTDRVWHITGSYTYAAMYTGRLDYSDMVPMDITLEGTFGLADSEGKVTLG